jgi:hypothetical protein
MMAATKAPLDKVLEALRSHRFKYQNEKDLQKGIEEAFKAAGIRFEREKPIGADGEVIDFLVDGGIGIEIKIKGSPTAVARQLLGYAECTEISVLVLVTGKARLGRLPETLAGKKLHVVALWRSFL